MQLHLIPYCFETHFNIILQSNSKSHNWLLSYDIKIKMCIVFILSKLTEVLSHFYKKNLNFMDSEWRSG
jgi:hypothetical protein